ncbi:hypothetical protein [Sideroxydans sp. CL21]|uniref:hypothetical protein n=1 Tax=Sideroxydans sp. CL21 TaxID=2600596 RepID=UPI0024BD52FC|nr:hypothetical protein [Sideroxydans sp. CL21]
MGRKKDAFIALPTAQLRGKCWTRHVRQALLADNKVTRPNARLAVRNVARASNPINEAIIAKAGKIPSAKKLVDAKTMGGAEIVSRGRWKEWWDGVHPHPGTVELINKLVPDSQSWFRSQPGNNPVQNFLFALDLIAGVQNDSDLSMQALLRINHEWRPVAIKEGTARSIRYIGWKMPKLSDQRVDPAWITSSYQPLKPASILELMLWVGHYLHVQDGPHFVEWVFDILAAAVFIKSFINKTEFPVDQLNDPAADIVAMLLASFIQYRGSLAGSDDPKEWLRMRCHSFKDALPEGDQFYLLLLAAITEFDKELNRYDITVEEIKAILPLGK